MADWSAVVWADLVLADSEAVMFLEAVVCARIEAEVSAAFAVVSVPVLEHWTEGVIVEAVYSAVCAEVYLMVAAAPDAAATIELD